MSRVRRARGGFPARSVAFFLSRRVRGPSLAHPFGPAALGPDSLARRILGGRVSLAGGLAAMLVYLDAIGVRFSNSDADTATTRRLYSRWTLESVSRSGNVNSNGEDRGAVTEGLWRNWQ